MEKKTASSIMLTLLLTSMLMLAFNIQPVRAGTIIVPIDYPTIQAAVSASSTGDTIIVRNGIYIENVKVNKDHLTIKSESGAEVTIVRAANSSDHVVEITADYVTISGFTVRGANGSPSQYIEGVYLGSAGIYLKKVGYCNILDNDISSNTDGIFFESSDNNNILNNKIISNNVHGIWWLSSHGNNVSRNNITSCAYAVFSAFTYGDVISENIVTNDGQGISLQDISDCKVLKNTVTSGAVGISLFSRANNNVVFGNNITGHRNDAGLELSEASSNVVFENSVKNNYWGVYTALSNNNIIYHNTFAENVKQVVENELYPPSINVWDDGYPSGGNYWSDYRGADGNGDGIGDTPYTIDAYNKDTCPLMKPWGATSLPVGNCFVPYKIKVKFAVNDVREMVLDEYLKGVVAAEMSSGWPIEALKAQAVAARTFAVRTTQHNHVIEDVCTIVNTNGPHCQAWEPGPYNQNIEDAVSQTHNQVITYYGWILKNAMFFAWCNGHTVDSEDRFPNSKPYLRGTSCNGAKCMQYRAMYNPETCPYLASGNDISTCNCRVYDKHDPSAGGYYGHRVGMCQEGAKTLAQNGFSYADIIKHYYTDVDVVTGVTAERRIVAKVQSPVELSISDSENRITGLVNGSIRSEIPNSEYDEAEELITISLSNDSYRYIVAGIDLGLYGLIVANATEQGTTVFESDSIPIKVNATHQYTIDWDALSRGEEGVTVQADSDGDGVFEHTFTSDSKLTQSEFLDQTAPPPLSVSISPLSAPILVGQSVTFTSTVSGGYTPYGYQWYLNGAPVSEATSNTWAFTPTTGGIYYIHLKVTDAKGNTTQSQTARITAATVPVGGYSIPIEGPATAQPVLPYIALIAALTAVFTKLRPKTKRKRQKPMQSHLFSKEFRRISRVTNHQHS